MIKTRAPIIIKEILFGDGDIQSSAFTSTAADGIGLSLSQCELGEIGRKKDPLSREEFSNKAEVLMFFKNIESLDVIIENLQAIRKHFTDKEETKDKNNE